MKDETVETHPVQGKSQERGVPARVPKVVTMLAYEVYCHLHGSQQAMVSGDCRGGFSASELVAFLYARSFPREEWRRRVDEAFRGSTLY